MNWSTYLGDFGWQLLHALGENPYYLPTDYNPVVLALAQGDFVKKFGDMPGFSRMGVSKVATVCQMVMFDHTGGPEGDGKPKALRRHWYAWYKTTFAQPFAQQLGDTKRNAQGSLEMDDLAWSARLSETYASFVNTGEITYKQLWIEDASRMMEHLYAQLFAGCHIIIAVEKDSLFADFVAPAKALGARSVYSGKGKSSKAAIEKCLRDHFGWSETWASPFTYDTPLIILHISDYDYDGEAVIGPTFAEQARRYTDYILEARVGIQPEHAVNAGLALEDKWYQVKVANKAYVQWAIDKALFMAHCPTCYYKWPVVGCREDISIDGLRYATHECPHCGGTAALFSLKQDVPHGLEVEAMKTRDYYGLLVDALLQVLPFDYIVERLRLECVADAYQAADTIATGIFADNETYQALLAEFDRLEQIKSEFEQSVRDELYGYGEPHVRDWENDDDDPEPAAFRAHVKSADGWAGPWRPFNTNDRTRSLVEWLADTMYYEIADLTCQEINWHEGSDD